MRRIRAICAMPRNERPFPLFRLQEIAGIRRDHFHRAAREYEGMHRNTRRALERAFTLLENDQVVVKHGSKHDGERYSYTFREPQPKQSMLTRVRMTERGPVVEFVAVNKAAFPVLPEINK